MAKNMEHEMETTILVLYHGNYYIGVIPWKLLYWGLYSIQFRV